MYTCTTLKSIRKLLQPINTFSKVGGYKINSQKSVTFLYISGMHREPCLGLWSYLKSLLTTKAMGMSLVWAATCHHADAQALCWAGSAPLPAMGELVLPLTDHHTWESCSWLLLGQHGRASYNGMDMGELAQWSKWGRAGPIPYLLWHSGELSLSSPGKQSRADLGSMGTENLAQRAWQQENRPYLLVKCLLVLMV